SKKCRDFSYAVCESFFSFKRTSNRFFNVYVSAIIVHLPEARASRVTYRSLTGIRIYLATETFGFLIEERSADQKNDRFSVYKLRSESVRYFLHMLPSMNVSCGLRLDALLS